MNNKSEHIENLWLWLLCATAIVILTTLLGAMIFKSLKLSIYLMIIFIFAGIAIWQREKIIDFTIWFTSHPTTKNNAKKAGFGVLKIISILNNVLISITSITLNLIINIISLPFKPNHVSEWVGESGSVLHLNLIFQKRTKCRNGRYYYLFLDKYDNRMKTFLDHKINFTNVIDARIEILSHLQFNNIKETEFDLISYTEIN